MAARLLIAAFASVCIFVSATEIADRLEGGLIPPVDPIHSAENLAAEERWAEVKILSEFIVAHPGVGDDNKAADLARRADNQLNSFHGQVQSFAHGAITGEPTDLVSMLGSLSLDLFVIGDIRDLAVQGWKEATDGSGDTVILALSAIGLTTTLAPHLDWVPALLKALKRTGALSKGMIRSLTTTARQALKTGDYGKLSTVVGDFGKTARRLGPGPTRGVMASVDSAEDLAKVARAAEVDAGSTYVLARLFGKNGVKMIDNNGKNVGALAATIKTGSRVTKAVKKSTAAVSTTWLSVIFAISVLILIATVIPGHRRFAPWRTSPQSAVLLQGKDQSGK